MDNNDGSSYSSDSNSSQEYSEEMTQNTEQSDQDLENCSMPYPLQAGIRDNYVTPSIRTTSVVYIKKDAAIHTEQSSMGTLYDDPSDLANNSLFKRLSIALKKNRKNSFNIYQILSYIFASIGCLMFSLFYVSPYEVKNANKITTTISDINVYNNLMTITLIMSYVMSSWTFFPLVTRLVSTRDFKKNYFNYNITSEQKKRRFTHYLKKWYYLVFSFVNVAMQIVCTVFFSQLNIAKSENSKMAILSVPIISITCAILSSLFIYIHTLINNKQ